jgi:4-amino-4-deoxy-L-arabinose transferase-like glycosyltransferase
LTSIPGFWSDEYRKPRTALLWVLAVGLVIRLAILASLSGFGTPNVDEQDYVALAKNILQGNGFAREAGQPTSIRPPLFPGLVAATWWVFGTRNLQAVRALQIGLALGTVCLVYLLGRRAFNPTIGVLAAAVFWLYPSLVFFNFTILTETLFTFLLVAFVLLTLMLVDRPRPWIAVCCGVALGLAALTRSILWPVPLVLCPLLVLLIRSPMRVRLAAAALVLAGYAAVVAPWAIRNTRLQHVFTVVDTMGGMNLRMGNYEHTPEDRMWDAVSLPRELDWSYALALERPGRRHTEGEKDKWAQRKALEYMAAHPGTTLRRSLIKFADFWGLEREFIAGIRIGYYQVPPAAAMIAPLAITFAYLVVVLTGIAGIWLSPPEARTQIVLLLPLVVITGLHSIVFGHSRYHIPLIPILAVYGAAFVSGPLRERLPRHRPALIGAAVSVAFLIAVWARQVMANSERIRAVLGDVG